MKRILKIIAILIAIISIIYVVMLFIPQNTQLQNNSGESISYLSEDKGVPMINVFNFNKEEIIKNLKFKKRKIYILQQLIMKSKKNSCSNSTIRAVWIPDLCSRSG